MVYRGKPSPGCALCRARRLLCDRRRPSCSQCLRVNRECSGYQDLQALRIHDQSNEIAAKAQAQSRARRGSRKSTKLPTTVQSAALSESIPPAIPSSMDEQAIAYTFKRYVGTTQNRGLLSYLPLLLSEEPSPVLQATIRAVGLAGMSRALSLPELKYSAGLEYGTALLATNRALQDIAVAKRDSTLAAVVMLSTYEMITCQGSKGGHDFMRGWINHVQGAARLLELRGTEQMKSPAGLALFTLVRMQVAFSNIFCRQPSSPEIASLSLAAKASRDNDSQTIEDFFAILAELADISIDSDKIFTEENTSADPILIIRKALHLDADLLSWSLSINSTWRYKPIETPVLNHTNTNTNDKKPYSFYHSSRYHVYPNIDLASMWNNYHQTRIIIHGIIQSMCKYLLELDPAHGCRQTLNQSVATSKQMIDDICASVPYYFTSGETGVGGLLRLSWPLFIAADSSVSTRVEKEWLRQTLEKIAEITGAQQALTMAQFLRKGWAVPFIPGNAGRVRLPFRG